MPRVASLYLPNLAIDCLRRSEGRRPPRRWPDGGVTPAEFDKASTSTKRIIMRKPQFYRYFLGFRPYFDLWGRLAAIGEEAGQQVRLHLLHLTLCVIAESFERDHFLLRGVQSALAGNSLHSFPVHLGNVKGGPQGAMLKALGSQHDIQDFYRTLISFLGRRGIAPLHRKWGLRAHVTLGHEPSRFEPFKAPIEWFPAELLLIESEVGLSRHNVIARWPLLPRRQPLLPFEAPLPRRAVA